MFTNELPPIITDYLYISLRKLYDYKRLDASVSSWQVVHLIMNIFTYFFFL